MDISKSLLISIALIAVADVSFAASPKLNIKLKNGTEVEQRTKDQVERLAQQKGLDSFEGRGFSR